MNKAKELRQRSKRTKQLVIAAAMATAVGGFGVAVTLPANAATNDIGTWVLSVGVTADRLGPGSIEIKWKDSNRNDASVCYSMKPGETKVFNQTGVLGAAAHVSLFGIPDCSTETRETVNFVSPSNDFNSPSNGGEIISVTFDLSGGHVG